MKGETKGVELARWRGRMGEVCVRRSSHGPAPPDTTREEER